LRIADSTAKNAKNAEEDFLFGLFAFFVVKEFFVGLRISAFCFLLFHCRPWLLASLIYKTVLGHFLASYEISQPRRGLTVKPLFSL